MAPLSTTSLLGFLLLSVIRTVTALPQLHNFESDSIALTTPVLMGLASSYGAIAASTLTSSGNTVITGNCGTYPGSSVTGFPPGKCSGTTSKAGTAAGNAEAACLLAYNSATGLVPTAALAASDLGGLTLKPGVYTFPTLGATLSTTLTLNGTGNATGQFVFQIRSTLKTSAGSAIKLIGGAQACNVYFVMGSSGTIGAASALKGNFLAYTMLALAEAASNQGTLCALNGAVTLIDNALVAQTSCTT